MKIFISSLIKGMEDIRAAARAAITTFDYVPIMAEDFNARPFSPQVTCLSGLRQSAAVILILGERYGDKQASGYSPTHEEFLEARERLPLLVFVQEGMNPEPAQAAFVREVQGWDTGFTRKAFSNPADLQKKISKALLDMAVAAAGTPFDASELLARTLAAFPDRDSGYHQGAVLLVSLAGGPSQSILRPAEVENASLSEKLTQEAMFGSQRIFKQNAGTEKCIDEGRLVLEQKERHARRLCLDSQGGVFIQLPLEENRDGGMMSVIVEEVVKEQMTAALRYTVWLLNDVIDPRQRLSHVVVAASIVGGMGMRTRAENRANPNSFSSRGFGRGERKPVYLSPPHMLRPALSQQLDAIVEDLTIFLRRQFDQ